MIIDMNQNNYIPISKYLSEIRWYELKKHEVKDNILTLTTQTEQTSIVEMALRKRMDASKKISIAKKGYMFESERTEKIYSFLRESKLFLNALDMAEEIEELNELMFYINDLIDNNAPLIAEKIARGATTTITSFRYNLKMYSFYKTKPWEYKLQISKSFKTDPCAEAYLYDMVDTFTCTCGKYCNANYLTDKTIVLNLLPKNFTKRYEIPINIDDVTLTILAKKSDYNTNIDVFIRRSGLIEEFDIPPGGKEPNNHVYRWKIFSYKDMPENISFDETRQTIAARIEEIEEEINDKKIEDEIYNIAEEYEQEATKFKGRS